MTRGERLGLVAGVVVLLVWSGITPHDRLTWWLEVLPVLVAGPLLWMTTAGFPLTPLAYRLIALHCAILIVGGHYTYAHVPLGEWARTAFDLTRNNYDRLGHVAQGFIPAILAREVLRRKTPLRPGGWLFFVTTSVCLAISAAFELFEWLTAVLLGGSADSYLATQGDVWDTQWDMFCALCGAIVSQLLFSRMHDRQMSALERGAPE